MCVSPQINHQALQRVPTEGLLKVNVYTLDQARVPYDPGRPLKGMGVIFPFQMQIQIHL